MFLLCWHFRIIFVVRHKESANICFIVNEVCLFITTRRRSEHVTWTISCLKRIDDVWIQCFNELLPPQRESFLLVCAENRIQHCFRVHEAIFTSRAAASGQNIQFVYDVDEDNESFFYYSLIWKLYLDRLVMRCERKGKMWITRDMFTCWLSVEIDARLRIIKHQKAEKFHIWEAVWSINRRNDHLTFSSEWRSK